MEAMDKKKILREVRDSLLGLRNLSAEVEALGIFGSLARGDFREQSDVDIFFVVKGKGVSKEEELSYWQIVRNCLRDLDRDITVMVIPRGAIEAIDNWYILRLAKEAILIRDKGDIRFLFKRILEAAKKSGLVEKEIDGTKVWCLEKGIRPGQVVEVNLDEE